MLVCGGVVGGNGLKYRMFDIFVIDECILFQSILYYVCKAGALLLAAT